MDALTVRPHDLIRIARPSDLPDWAHRSWQAAPWVVVRRAPAAPGRLPVGVRGHTRAHRFATEVPTCAVTEALTPAMLANRADHVLSDLPATRALRGARCLRELDGLDWGPAGSVGFELATGVPTITTDSDLDLVVRLEQLPPRTRLLALYQALRQLPARADCQLETPAGAVALGDLVTATDNVLLHTTSGPRLIPVPWPATSSATT